MSSSSSSGTLRSMNTRSRLAASAKVLPVSSKPRTASGSNSARSWSSWPRRSRSMARTSMVKKKNPALNRAMAETSTKATVIRVRTENAPHCSRRRRRPEPDVPRSGSVVIVGVGVPAVVIIVIIVDGVGFGADDLRLVVVIVVVAAAPGLLLPVAGRTGVVAVVPAVPRTPGRPRPAVFLGAGLALLPLGPALGAEGGALLARGAPVGAVGRAGVLAGRDDDRRRPVALVALGGEQRATEVGEHGEGHRDADEDLPVRAHARHPGKARWRLDET